MIWRVEHPPRLSAAVGGTPTELVSFDAFNLIIKIF
jgi:hypothetical protein